MTHTTYCDQGHPAHDGTLGCGPCRDERDAGLGERRYARPRRVYRLEDGTRIDTRKVGRKGC